MAPNAANGTKDGTTPVWWADVALTYVQARKARTNSRNRPCETPRSCAGAFGDLTLRPDGQEYPSMQREEQERHHAGEKRVRLQQVEEVTGVLVLGIDRHAFEDIGKGNAQTRRRDFDLSATTRMTADGVVPPVRSGSAKVGRHCMPALT